MDSLASTETRIFDTLDGWGVLTRRPSSLLAAILGYCGAPRKKRINVFMRPRDEGYRSRDAVTVHDGITC